MKKLMCVLLACALGITAAGLAGCGCSNNKQEPGYRIEATEPDLKNDVFGFFILNDKEVMLSKYSGNGGEVKIPDAYDKYKVTVIGHSVFNDKNVTSLEIPDSVRELKDYAFASNRELKSVKLPENLEKMGTNVFFNCTSLETVEFNKKLKEIGFSSFCGTALKSVTFPEDGVMTSLGPNIFFQCRQLSEVNLPANITKIEDSTFAECADNLTIIAPKGSYAESYAKKNKFNFKATN